MNSKKCFRAADILLPDLEKNDPSKWAVIACDQFTSEPEYWHDAEKTVKGAPSTLNMILPEVYLKDTESRVQRINETMKEYLNTILLPHSDTMVYVERTQSDKKVRRGIVMAIDLECYDYTKGATSLIRATEATVVERIPPRVAIRRGAAVELPHVMLLIDDPEKTVIEPLIGADAGELAYDTELMLGGGHIVGRYLDGAEIRRIERALDALITPEAIAKKYGKHGLSPLLFAVGDGNHSLASAKAMYEEIKEQLGAEAAMTHPARYALVEVVNIHDPALGFEPIYRVMFGTDPEDVLRELEKYVSSLGGDAAPQRTEYVSKGMRGVIEIPSPHRQLTVGTLQDFIDSYISSHEGVEVDYIHGADVVRELAAGENAIGFLLPAMEKSELFPTVVYDGALPRKTFSMGEANEKRYYMECRKIGE